MLLGLRLHRVVGGHAQHRGVCLAGPGDHVLDEVPVTGRVDDRPVVVRCEELLVCDIDGDTAFTLFLEVVHHVREPESSLATLGRFLLESIDDVLFDVAGVQQQPSDGR